MIEGVRCYHEEDQECVCCHQGLEVRQFDGLHMQSISNDLARGIHRAKMTFAIN